MALTDQGKTTTICLVATTVVLGILCLIGSVLGFYHESSKAKVLHWQLLFLSNAIQHAYYVGPSNRRRQQQDFPL